MKESIYSALQEKMSAFCQEISDDLEKNYAGDYRERVAMWQELHGVYLASMAKSLQQWAEQYDRINGEEGTIVDVLEANEAVVEFLDKNTGTLFRRNLPINCIETANGIVLSGETMDGQPSKIAFLSETALQKINDLVGKGPDVPHHDHHDHHEH